MRKAKSLTSGAVLAVVLSLLLCACSSGQGNQSGTNTSSSQPSNTSTPESSAPAAETEPEPEPEPEEPALDISIMTVIFLNAAGNFDPPPEDNQIQQEIEQRTNTNLRISWVPDNTYKEKINVSLAGGDLADLTFIDSSNVFGSQFRTMVSQGAFWDLTDLIGDYPNLQRLPGAAWTNSKMQDGRNYLIPKVRPLLGNGGIIIRKDWLDRLGLDIPETMDELYAAAKAFTDQDPDGDGTQNTTGFGMNEYGFVESIFAKTTGDWALRDGKLINMNLLPETREALIWLNNAYQEGLIPKDYTVMQGSQATQLGQSGKAGIYYGVTYTNWTLLEPLLKLDPQADFVSLPGIAGYATEGSGFSGGFAIPKTVPEDKVKKLLAFMDYGASDEGVELAWFGLAGEHFTVEDGVKKINDAGRKAGAGYETYGQIFNQDDRYQRAYRSGIPAALYERNKQVIDNMDGHTTPDYAFGLYSPTNTEVGSEIKKKFTDLKTKIILGSENISAWDELVSEMTANADLQAITAELNEAYQKRQ